MADILQAARSYYGLADTDVRKTDIYTNEAGQLMCVLEFVLTNDDIVNIVEHMGELQQPDAQPDTAIIEGPTVEAMREAYNALSKAEKGRYGSFARYMAESSGGIVDIGQQARADYYDSMVSDTAATLLATSPGRQVVHVDAPEEPEPVSMDAVWLKERECSPAQIAHASDSRWGEGEKYSAEYLIQWAMLTDEQKQKAKQSQEQNVTLNIKGMT